MKLQTLGAHVGHHVNFWDPASGKAMGNLDGHSVALSSDGNLLALAGDDDRIYFWRLGRVRDTKR